MAQEAEDDTAALLTRIQAIGKDADGSTASRYYAETTVENWKEYHKRMRSSGAVGILAHGGIRMAETQAYAQPNV